MDLVSRTDVREAGPERDGIGPAQDLLEMSDVKEVAHDLDTIITSAVDLAEEIEAGPAQEWIARNGADQEPGLSDGTEVVIGVMAQDHDCEPRGGIGRDRVLVEIQVDQETCDSEQQIITTHGNEIAIVIVIDRSVHHHVVAALREPVTQIVINCETRTEEGKVALLPRPSPQQRDQAPARAKTILRSGRWRK